MVGGSWKIFCKINNVVTMLNDMRDFCRSDLKCSVMICSASNYVCVYMRPSSWSSQVVKV